MTDTATADSGTATDLPALVNRAQGNQGSALFGQIIGAQAAKDRDPKVKASREKMVKTIDADMALTDDAYKGIEPIGERVKPWDAKAESAKYQTDPLSAFGSFGGIFALAASAFTHTPMINAMNGMAAAMNAVRANDRQAYDDAYEAWKSNTDLALKRHQAEVEDYNAAMEKGKNDPALMAQELQAYTATYDDKIAAAHLALGDYTGLEQIKLAQQSAALKLLELKPQLEAERQKGVLSFGYDREWADSPAGKSFFDSPQGKAWTAQNANTGKIAPDEVHAASYFRATKAATDASSPYSARFGGLPQFIQAKANEKLSSGGTVTPDDYKSWTAEWNAGTKAPSNELALYIRDKELEKGGPLTADERLNAAKEWNAGTKAPGTAPVQQYLAAEKDAAERAGQPWGADQIAKATQDFGRDSKGGLTDDAADFVVGQYLAGDRQAMVGFARNPADKEKLTNVLAQQAKARGITPQMMAVLGAEFQGLVSGERTLGTRSAQLGLASGELDQFIPQARDASKAVPRSAYPAANMAIIAYRDQSGDPNVRVLGAALQAVENAYSQVITRAGVPTDAAREAAEKLISSINSDMTLNRVLDQIERETAGAVKAPDVVREEFREGFLTGRGQSVSKDKQPDDGWSVRKVQ